MRVLSAFGLALGLGVAGLAAPSGKLTISSISTEVDSDQSTVYYSTKTPILFGNDGGAATGGIRGFDLLDENLTQTLQVTPGRTKVVGVLYDIGERGRDVLVSIAAPDSVIRVWDIGDGLTEIPGAEKKALGDWSALCTWQAPGGAGGSYFYLFGKKQAMQFLVRSGNSTESEIEVLEIQTFALPVEPSSCAVDSTEGIVYFAAEDATIYNFQAAESMVVPDIQTLGQIGEDAEISGLAVYVAKNESYLFISQEDKVEVYSAELNLKGSLAFTGATEPEIQGTAIYQAKSEQYPFGVLSFAIESDEGKGFGVASLEPVFAQLNLQSNTTYSPRSGKPSSGPGFNGFPNQNGTPSCFAGFTGPHCDTVTCPNSCSGSSQGTCVGPNECQCRTPYAGPDCSWIGVEPKYETDANGGDGDDPAIWISAKSPNLSTIITTTKSEKGAGLAVFDLQGNLLQTMTAGEPNNVDVIYDFKLGNRTVDLAYAACREDDTLCLFEITPTGLLTSIPGGIQRVPQDYTVYGSCAYRSRVSGKQYLFVNEKSGRYLQFELHSSTIGTLSTTLVREFTGGSGGQPEGCVPDEENGFIFLGEEPFGLWRYEAEPEGSDEGYLVAETGDGTLYADVEGVTLLPGKTAEKGLIVVSCQGVSAYSVYRRQEPHEHVLTFTIGEKTDGSVDGVTNTDGAAGVSTGLNGDFPQGLLVVHDDANQLAEGGTAELASFKLVSLADVLGVDERSLLAEVDSEWDPRAL
ncbi:uncharacterized protein BDV17DRAFT_286606 [Aspergillus undulatus]|uniref:uncharacterized protein n=1 Tax=Aspergillus undulatus TaxID=1810928 RepID=UPI003CCE3698